MYYAMYQIGLNNTFINKSLMQRILELALGEINIIVQIKNSLCIIIWQKYFFYFRDL